MLRMLRSKKINAVPAADSARLKPRARGKTESRVERASPTSLRWRPSPAIGCRHAAAGDQKSCFRDYFCFDRRKLFHGERLKALFDRCARDDYEFRTFVLASVPRRAAWDFDARSIVDVSKCVPCVA
jgi:hypothetical protein